MNKSTRLNESLFISIAYSIITIVILTGITLLVLSNFTNQIYEYCCNKENGTLYMYECQDITEGFRGKDYIPCSELKTGYYCNFQNGTEIKADDLPCMINITNSENG